MLHDVHLVSPWRIQVFLGKWVYQIDICLFIRRIPLESLNFSKYIKYRF